MADDKTDGAEQHESSASDPDRLKPYEFKPGHSGNPKGLKPGTKHGPRARLRRLLKQQAPDALLSRLESKGLSQEEKDNASVIAGMLYELALGGEPADRIRAIKLIFAQVEDPLVTRIAPTTPDGERPYGSLGDAEVARLMAKAHAAAEAAKKQESDS